MSNQVLNNQADKKAEMRAQMKAQRAAIPPDVRIAAALAIADHAADLFANHQIIAFYHPLADELDPAILVDAARAAGCIACLPVVTAKDMPLTFRRWDARDHLVTGAFDVMEPSKTAEVLVPDLICLPLLAADMTGGRLGYGGGFYDRTLAARRGQGAAVTAIGLAYRDQITQNVPMDVMDQRLDGVLTPDGLVMFG